MAHLGILVRHKHTHFAGEGASEDNVVGGASLAHLRGQVDRAVLPDRRRAGRARGSGADQPRLALRTVPVAERQLSVTARLVHRVAGGARCGSCRRGRFAPSATRSPTCSSPGYSCRASRSCCSSPGRSSRRASQGGGAGAPRPRSTADRPLRTALGVATISFYVVLFLGGGTDVLATSLHLSFNELIWAFRVMIFVVPVASGFLAHRICRELQARDDASRHVSPRNPTPHVSSSV